MEEIKRRKKRSKNRDIEEIIEIKRKELEELEEKQEKIKTERILKLVSFMYDKEFFKIINNLENDEKIIEQMKNLILLAEEVILNE